MSIRVPLHALLSIVRDGRFKTRHEGSKSTNPSRSIEEETAVWSLEPTKPETYPIFGYAASFQDIADVGARASLHSTYGSARVLLSDGLRAQTSVFFGDSLSWIRNRTGAPSQLDEPDELTWPFD